MAVKHSFLNVALGDGQNWSGWHLLPDGSSTTMFRVEMRLKKEYPQVETLLALDMLAAQGWSVVVVSDTPIAWNGGSYATGHSKYLLRKDDESGSLS